MPEWKLDKMHLEDLASVMVIERSCFAAPWPEGAFREEIVANPFARCLVARSSGDAGMTSVGGYICYWILHEELLINNIAVAPVLRRQGLGRRMLAHALEEATSAGCLWAFLEVRPSNEAAISLYRRHGFEVLARRKQYYGDSGEDALVMRASLKGFETE